jgi:hypothetical protein
MKTQRSRDSFRPDASYSGVYLQQGRMILDADWNELTDIQKSRLVTALRDAVAGGAPRVDGLRLVADPAGSSNIRIQPGVLYVDGVPARLDGEGLLEPDQQPDYPIQSSFNAQSLRLYADVWERTVTALERSELMDAALHGADTATRTRTMLQVKWCADTMDPLDDAVNPPLGDAPLTLKLRQITSSGDQCDPCASQVSVDERLGNYLFRVEVHDLDGNELILKWSRDNGAEACRTDALPPGFDLGPWVWEFFDDDTERLLGNHFATNPQKLRGLIKEVCNTPTDAQEPQQYVRQWDGYLRIDLTTGQVQGRDRGVALASGTVDSQSHGRVNLTVGVLKVNLELMEITLDTSGRKFVPGDYWQADVREARHESGDIVLDAEPPLGVRHHYLFLGEIGINRKLVTQDDPFRRRMAFPPLTDLTAGDVGFTDNCAGLFAGADNVQEALDNLCGIGAEDIAYPLPNCGAQEGNSIKDHLKALLDPDNDGNLTVKDALDNLLCQLNAGRLPYEIPDCAADGASVQELLGLAAGGAQVGPVLDALMCQLGAKHLPLDKTDATLCSDLQAESVVTVQDALQVLCTKSAGGCAVVVTSPEHLAVLLTEFAGSSTATDLWLCLKPGTYPIDTDLTISGKRSLRLSGAGPQSVVIDFRGAVLTLDAEEVILENLSWTVSSGTGQMVIHASDSRTQGCRFFRTSADPGTQTRIPMIRIDGRGKGACSVEWRDNFLYAQIREVKGIDESWAGATVVGDAKLSGILLDFARPDILGDQTAYDEAIRKAAERVMAMPKDARTNWKSTLDELRVGGTGGTSGGGLIRGGGRGLVRGRTSRGLTPGRLAASRSLTGPWAIGRATRIPIGDVLGADTVKLADAVLGVEDLILQWVTFRPHIALRLEDEEVGGILEGNQVDGWVLLGNGLANDQFDQAIALPPLQGDGVVASGGDELRLVANRLAAIKANVTAASPGTGEDQATQLTGYARVFLAQNSFAETLNRVVASTFVAEGNTWTSSGDSPGWILADRATFTGNLLEGTSENVGLTSTVQRSFLASVGNVRVSLNASS